MIRNLIKIILPSIIFFALHPSFCSAYIYIHAYVRSGNHLIEYSLCNILNKKSIVNPYYEPILGMIPGDIGNKEGWRTPIKTIPNEGILIGHIPKFLGLSL